MINNIINYSSTPNIKVNLIADKVYFFYGEDELMHRAISNLINNAIKYSQSDKIDVILSDNKTTLKIEVKDYGIGIEKKYFERLFEKFFRIDKARSRKTGGTGLGLAIVKNIIELHNGTIHIESELNKGTNFIIELPYLTK